MSKSALSDWMQSVPLKYDHNTTATADFDAVWDLVTSVHPDTFGSARELREWDERQLAAGRMNDRILVWDGSNLAGSVIVGQLPFFPPERVWMGLNVHPDRRHSGIGRSLLERAETAAAERDIAEIDCSVRETEPRSLSFAAAAGYLEFDRAWRSTLDLSSFAPSAWERSIEAVLSSEISFVSVAQLGSRDSWIDRLHLLYVELDGDVPDNLETIPVTLDDWVAQSIDSPQALPEGFFVAFDGDDMVGLTELVAVDGNEDALNQELTGVRASHRGRGIASALKAHALAWAKASGYRQARTFNAQTNAPMLAVNSKLGFVREHGSVMFRKHLGS